MRTADATRPGRLARLLGYALFGGSRQLVVSPTSATAAISAALVAPVAVGDAARFGELSAALAILVGLALVSGTCCAAAA